MKRVVCCLGMLLFLGVLLASWADCAKIWAMARDANLWLVGQKLDHVYVCTKSDSTKCYALPGGTDGGSTLSDTSADGSSDKVKCVASQSSCKIYWALNGTCQQGANRMLYGVRKTVSKARGYSLSSRIFGTYGGNSSYCIGYCFNQA